MKKTVKRFVTILLTMAMIIASMSFAFAANEGTAYISFAAADWGVQYWMDGNDYAPVVAKNATVTGPGQYTVSLDFSGVEGGAAAGIAFFDVEIAGGESLYPDSFMQIDSVKINGSKVALGTTYTSSDNDVDTRVNLYNEWVGEVKEGRTNGLEYSAVTATPVDISSFDLVSKVEVTFTLITADGDDGSAPVILDAETTTTTESGALPTTSGMPLLALLASGATLTGLGLTLRRKK